MRCKLVPICSNADSWSVALTGDTVSPTSPNKHFSVLPPKQMPSLRQDALHAAGLPQVTWCHSWKWESCAMRSLMHACWTSLFVHLVKQYPHNHHRCHLIPTTHTHTHTHTLAELLNNPGVLGRCCMWASLVFSAASVKTLLSSSPHRLHLNTALCARLN